MIGIVPLPQKTGQMGAKYIVPLNLILMTP